MLFTARYWGSRSDCQLEVNLKALAINMLEQTFPSFFLDISKGHWDIYFCTNISAILSLKTFSWSLTRRDSPHNQARKQTVPLSQISTVQCNVLQSFSLLSPIAWKVHTQLFSKGWTRILCFTSNILRPAGNYPASRIYCGSQDIKLTEKIHFSWLSNERNIHYIQYFIFIVSKP